jgi:hypothetical protein
MRAILPSYHSSVSDVGHVFCADGSQKWRDKLQTFAVSAHQRVAGAWNGVVSNKFSIPRIDTESCLITFRLY